MPQVIPAAPALGHGRQFLVSLHRMGNVGLCQFSESALSFFQFNKIENIRVSAPKKGKVCFVKHVFQVCILPARGSDSERDRKSETERDNRVGGDRPLQVRVKGLGAPPWVGQRAPQSAWYLQNGLVSSPLGPHCVPQRRLASSYLTKLKTQVSIASVLKMFT